MSDQEQFNDEEQVDVQDLLTQGVAAARAGDKEQARGLFEQVVSADNDNEQGWYYLAVVIEDTEVRIECLQRVLTINPEHKQAQAALEKLGGTMPEKEASGKKGLDLSAEIIPGVTRKMVALTVAGLIAMLMVICCMVGLIFNNNNRKTQNATATAVAMQSTSEAQRTGTAVVLTGTAVVLTETAANLPENMITPSEVPTIASVVTLPPTWTPPPSATPNMSMMTATPLATAVGSGLFSGEILAASGQDRVGEGFVPLVRIPLDGNTDSFQFFEERANTPRLSPRGDLMVYTRYSTATREQGIELRWMDNSEEPKMLTTLLGGIILREQDGGDFSPDGSKLAFTASEGGNRYRDIFVVDLAELFRAYEASTNGEILPAEISERAMTKLTNSTVDSYSPRWGDANRLIIVQDTSMTGGGVDLKILTTSGELTDVTSNGNSFVENHPQIAPDGLRVVFDAYAAETPDDVDIYIMALSGGVPLLQVENDTIDTNPIWSDDGNYIAYASDRTRNNFEIFIMEVGTGANYQVTVNDDYDMPGDWLPAAEEE